MAENGADAPNQIDGIEKPKDATPVSPSLSYRTLHDRGPSIRSSRRDEVHRLAGSVSFEMEASGTIDYATEHYAGDHKPYTGDQLGADLSDESDYAQSTSSVESIASSITSIGGTDVPDTIINQVVDVVFCTAALIPVKKAAIWDPAIGPESFLKNLRRMVERYGATLKLEVVTKDERTASTLLRSSSVAERIAGAVMSRRSPLMIPVDPPAPADDVESDAHDEFPDPEGNETMEDVGNNQVQTILEFLQRSQAYLLFKAELLAFVHAPYEKRISRSLKATSESTGGPERDKVTLYRREMSWVPPRLINFRVFDDNSIGNRVKAWVEETMGETWDWWPLQPRKHSVP